MALRKRCSLVILSSPPALAGPQPEDRGDEAYAEAEGRQQGRGRCKLEAFGDPIVLKASDLAYTIESIVQQIIVEDIMV